ncbi:MAG: HAD hydrolase-like protein [Anaerolineae bacterium]|nr:HAD hydrolase-like protein [Anaerolineae bacterium]
MKKSKSKSKLKIDALIFSLNDVLIDVSRSYREVVPKTVQLYLEQALGLPSSDEPLLTADEVTLLQKVGNFTDHWELAAAFILYFIEMLPPVPIPTFPSKVHVPAIIAYLQMARGGLQITVDNLREQKDVSQMAAQIAAKGGGINGAYEALPGQNRHLLVDVGSITKTNLVGRIFQELYLGKALFERIYEQPAVTVQSAGYIENETLLIDRDILTQIREKVPLGLICNRPRIEVNYSLQAHQIEDFFQAIVTLDEVREAESKPIPDPWPLLEAARRIYPTPVHTAYIGPNPGDVQAAKAANQTMPFTAIACLVGAHDKEALRREFEKLKANIILGHPDHLKDLILD